MVHISNKFVCFLSEQFNSSCVSQEKKPTTTRNPQIPSINIEKIVLPTSRESYKVDLGVGVGVRVGGGCGGGGCLEILLHSAEHICF